MSKAKINQLLESRWDEKKANSMSEAQLLLYRSDEFTEFLTTPVLDFE